MHTTDTYVFTSGRSSTPGKGGLHKLAAIAEVWKVCLRSRRLLITEKQVCLDRDAVAE